MERVVLNAWREGAVSALEAGVSTTEGIKTTHIGHSEGGKKS